MKPVAHLDVLENDYMVVSWYVEPAVDCRKIHSDIRPFPGMNELPDYRDSGVYRMADVPFTRIAIDPTTYPEDEPYLAFARAYSDRVCESVRAGHAHLAVGSYCTHIPSILGGIRRAVGPDCRIGVVWLDAHADNQIVERTVDRRLRLVGVPMSTFLGQTLAHWRHTVGLEPPIAGTDVLAADLRYLDAESIRNLEEAQVHVATQPMFQDRGRWADAVQQLAAQVDAIFLHVDADILHHEYIPAYEYDVVNGNDLETVRANIAAVMDTGKVLGASVMCIGFEKQPDRLRDVNNITGIRLVSTVLSHWKQQPDLTGGKAGNRT